MPRIFHAPTALIMLVLLAGCGERAPVVASPAATRGPATFVGRQSCTECHSQQPQTFTGSDHDLAMQPATAQTVLGDFDDASFTHAGVTSTFHRRGDSFVVRTDGPDGEMREYPIAYTFGVRPLQQYLVQMERGRYQTLSLCWDARTFDEGGQRWFHVYGDEEIDHRDQLHWTGPLQNWNYMCAECHSTHLEKGYVAAEDRFETTWSEIDVSCESCHGPGSNHVAWAHEVEAGQKPADADYALVVALRVPDEAHWTFDVDAPTAHRASPLVENVQVETCGRCHSRRALIWPEYRHGDPLADTHRLALLDEGLYHADGQILDEVYVHGSFLQSKMYHQGVTCTDCHEPHGGGLWAPGNALCARCHQPDVFDTPAHHFHPIDSTSAQCVECHMRERTYMVVDPRRDHSFRVPRPDLTMKVGVPNACNQCHVEQSAQWAQEAVLDWYGSERSSQVHFSEALHAGREARSDAEGLLLGVINDEQTPGIVKATAVSLLRSSISSRSAPAIERAVQDEDPLVRRSAAELLDVFDTPSRIRIGAVLLSDPIRTVRLAAALSLADVSAEAFAADQRDAFRACLNEYRSAQLFNADRAEAHVNLGNLEARLGRTALAEEHYRHATSMPSSPIPAYVNLADLYRAMGRDNEGLQVLRDALVVSPDSAAVHHSLGLLLIRLQQPDEALERLARAAELQPGESRYAYVYGIALYDSGDVERALWILARAHNASPTDRDVLQALVSYNVQLTRHDAALGWARRLAQLAPDDQAILRLIESLERPP